jgi:hypothetical protein
MRYLLVAAAALAVSSTATPAWAHSRHHASFQLNGTTWIFTDKKGMKIEESIDDQGNYIANTVAGKHLDHGTAVMKGNKACFTSKMTKEGEVCWTTTPVRIGHSMVTKSDKGEKLRVTRVKYKKLSMG